MSFTSTADDAVLPSSSLDRVDVRDSVLKGLAWLAGQQGPEGAWRNSHGVTGLVLTCYVAAGYDYTNQTVQRGLGFLRMFYDEETGSMAESFLNYECAISLMAMVGAGDPQDSARIPRVFEFLKDLQYNAATTPPSNTTFFGGWPNYAGISDLSNSQFALLGLITTMLSYPSLKVSDTALANMTEYASECQNLPAVNSLPWARNASLPSYGDGGFVYNTLRSRTALGESKFESYGSITGAGLYAYLACGHGYDHPETAAARAWLDREYTLAVNPRMEDKGLYYHLWTLARVLAISPQDLVIDGAGKIHDWRTEIVRSIIDRQRADGGWDGNPFVGWREEEPELSSMYSIFTMEAAYLMAPNPRFELEVSGASSARFVSLDGTELKTDASEGITVTATKLTATDPETFRKVWVELEGTQGASATVKATGTWGQGRRAETSAQVVLGSEGSRVFCATGGFAGAFGIYLQAYPIGPVLEVDIGPTVELVRGAANIVKLRVREVSGAVDASTVNVILELPAGATVDVSEQRLTVPKGGEVVLNLSVFVPLAADKGNVGSLVVSSDNAPPSRHTVKYVDEGEDGEGPDVKYWVLILVLFAVVVALIALPAVGRRRAGKEERAKAYEPDERDPGRET